MNFRYDLQKDGKLVKSFTSANKALEWLQWHYSQSWDYAFKHGGYALYRVNDDGSKTRVD